MCPVNLLYVSVMTSDANCLVTRGAPTETCMVTMNTVMTVKRTMHNDMLTYQLCWVNLSPDKRLQTNIYQVNLLFLGFFQRK